MTPVEVERMLKFVRDAGMSWWVDQDPDARLQQFVTDAAEADREIEQRLLDPRLAAKQRPPRDPILNQMLADPASMKPLIQTFASPMTPVARAMVYCILMGSTIQSVELDYEQKARFKLTVQLRLPDGRRTTFDTDELWDFEVLRHFGMAKVSDHPLLHGYYPFRER